MALQNIINVIIKYMCWINASLNFCVNTAWPQTYVMLMVMQKHSKANVHSFVISEGSCVHIGIGWKIFIV